MNDIGEAPVTALQGLVLTTKVTNVASDHGELSLNDTVYVPLISEDMSRNASALMDVAACLWDVENVTKCSWTNRTTANDTLTLSDLQLAEQQPEKVYWALMLVILPFLAVFGNILIILSVYKERSLQSATNYFIVSLAFADLLVAAAVMPFAVYVLVNVDWELSDTLCDFYIAVDVTCSTASIFNLVAISIDRFIAVTQPIKYSKHKNSKRVALTIVIVWVVSAAIGSPIMLGLNTSPERVPHLCVFYNSDFIIYSSLSSFYIPCIVMVFLYYKIFKVIHDRARKALAKNEPRLRGVVIQNADSGQDLEDIRAAQRDKNGNKGLQIATIADPDLLTSNTGSRSQPEEEDYDDLGTETGGEKSPDREDESTFLQRKLAGANSVAAYNRNHDSSYPASNTEETQFLAATHRRAPEPKRNGAAVPLLTVSVVVDAPSSEEKDPDSHTTLVKKKCRFNLCRRHKSSRKKREKASAKRERKATKTLAIVLGVFLICWVPFFTCNVIEAVCMKLQSTDCHLGVTVFLFTTWLGYVNSCVNPVIYTIFNPEFRKAFKKILAGPMN